VTRVAAALLAASCLSLFGASQRQPAGAAHLHLRRRLRAFDDLARRLEVRGYTFITLERALEDSAYASEDQDFGPAGVTWLHRWALTRKMPSATLAGEPVVPDWVTRISGIGQ
jgi:hypothetical protein